MLEEYSETLYKDIIESKTNLIFTIGEIAKQNLDRMSKDERFPYLKEIYIINLPYPRGNQKERLHQELKKYFIE